MNIAFTANHKQRPLNLSNSYLQILQDITSKNLLLLPKSYRTVTSRRNFGFSAKNKRSRYIFDVVLLFALTASEIMFLNIQNKKKHNLKSTLLKAIASLLIIKTKKKTSKILTSIYALFTVSEHYIK